MFDEDRQQRDIRRSPGSTGAWLEAVSKLLLSISVLAIALTGSFVTWERFRPAKHIQAGTQTPSPVTNADWTAVTEGLSALREENKALRAELNGIVGPGGVLSRIVERLQEGHRNDAAHRAAIDQLFMLMTSDGALNSVGGRTDPAGIGGPVEVTPIKGEDSNLPVHVIVTPGNDAAPPEGQDE